MLHTMRKPRFLATPPTIYIAIAALALAITPIHLAAQTTTSTYVLHKFARAIGKETDTVSISGTRTTLTSDFLFTDRGSKVPLTTSYVAGPHLRPISLSAKGRVSRESALELTVQITGDQAAISENGKTSTVPAPPVVFATAGYAPAAMQELMMRTWLENKRPASLPLLPRGAVNIESAGKLEVDLPAAGQPGTVKKEKLDGYTISGLIWGVESLWLNHDHQLVALISTDAEFDHFEAIRDDYESDLGAFISAAVKADLAALDKLAASAREPVTPKLAIVGATLINVASAPNETAEQQIPDSVVITAGDKIIAAGPRSAIQIPADAKVLDATGKFLIPGLWDMHAHYEQVEWGPIYLAAGVTSVRDVGNEFAFITTVRDVVNSGHGIGPEIFFAGIIDGEGPHALGAVNATTPEQARVLVDKYHDVGASQIKIYSSVKPDVVAAICTEAHRFGMTVTGHIPDGMTAIDGVNAGMDQINHVQYLAPLFEKPRMQKSDPPVTDFATPAAQKDLQFLVDHHTVVDPTMALFEMIYSGEKVSSFEPGVLKVAPQLEPALNQVMVSPEHAAWARATLTAYLQTIGALHKAGVPIVAGTDQAIPGYSLHRELELYVQAGFTPMEALQSATIVPARVLKVDANVGSIAPGKRADLVLLDGDPLADIANTRKVWKTIAAGAVYDPAPLWKSVDFQP
jgi:imidazolonepropionase-like amidohydrolase